MTEPNPKLARFFRKLATDSFFFLEALCSVADFKTQTNIRFKHNPAQVRYDREIRKKGTKKDVVGKSRKWGFSTKRLGDGFHDAMYMRNRIFRVVAHKEATNKETMRPLVWQLYSSAVTTLREVYGLNPYEFLPRVTNGNGQGTESSIEFGEIGSAVVFSTAAGAGVGQAERSDDLYLTEYADWEHAHYVFTKLSGSQPKGNPFTRLTIDFNADGVTNDAYLKYTRAKAGKGDPDWNGFVPFFAGILDAPEYYPADEMAIERLTLGDKRFKEVYPSNDEEMWVASKKSVLDWEHVEDAYSLGTNMGYQPDSDYRIHIVDTASGNPGGDYQVCTSWGLVDGIWIEAEEPIRGHWPEDVFGDLVADRCEQSPGLCMVERNYGGAVLIRLRERGVPNLYRHRHRDKTGKQYMQLGFPMTYASKRSGIMELQQMLRNHEVAFVTRALYTEAKEYEWKVKDNLQEDSMTEVAGAPDRTDAQGDPCHDDLIVTAIMLTQAIGKALAASGDAAQMRD